MKIKMIERESCFGRILCFEEDFMRFVIQRVTQAQCRVDGQITGSIAKGFLVLIGISQSDNEAVADKMVKKLVGMRIFEDGDGKTNLALADVDGALLLISQFTLYANCKKGNRPSFTEAGSPKLANSLYEYIIGQCRLLVPNVQTGIFGADMKLSLTNDGPFTVVLDSEELGLR